MPSCQCETIDSRRFNWTLTIQRNTASTQNTFGELVPQWSPLARNAVVWGSIEQKNGREFFSGQQINPDVNVVVTMRFRSDITPRDRFKINGTSRILEIVAMSDPDGGQRYLVCACREVL
jgi:SPP1 family predicted phage head-tail adaptor